MDYKELGRRIERAKEDIEREVRDRLPHKVGVTAVNHFRQNFRDAGWREPFQAELRLTRKCVGRNFY